MFKFVVSSCAQELPKSKFISLYFGWRLDASALRTFILARSKRDLTASIVMSKTHAVSAVLRFFRSCRKSTPDILRREPKSRAAACHPIFHSQVLLKRSRAMHSLSSTPTWQSGRIKTCDHQICFSRHNYRFYPSSFNLWRAIALDYFTYCEVLSGSAHCDAQAS